VVPQPESSFAAIRALINAIQPFVARASVLKNDQCTSEELVMNALEQKRRSFLFGLGALGISQVFDALVAQRKGDRL
jgi:hypothetical protein